MFACLVVVSSYKRAPIRLWRLFIYGGLTNSIDSNEEIDDGDTIEAVERHYYTRSRQKEIPTVLEFLDNDTEACEEVGF